MGGRCAEEIIFGDYTNGASNDIERATSLAHNMVCNWGMSEKLGPIHFHKSGISPFADNREHLDYSEETGKLIDQEVHNFIHTNYLRAKEILNEKRDILERLSEKLIVWETLDIDQVNRIMNGEDIGIPLINSAKESDDVEPEKEEQVAGNFQEELEQKSDEIESSVASEDGQEVEQEVNTKIDHESKSEDEA
jgi:cell division protease FtsH